MENELNTVTGGSCNEASLDSEALHLKGFMDEQFGTIEMLFHWPTDSAKVDEGWAKAGITSETLLFDYNRYYYKGKRISRRTAMHKIGIV